MIAPGGIYSNSSDAPGNTNCSSNEDSTDEENETDFTKEEEAKFAKRYDLYVTRFAKIDHLRAYCISRNTNLKY